MSTDAAATGPAPHDLGASPRSADVHVPHTGDEVLDAALAPLAGAGDQPLDAQVQTYVGVHRALQSRLADLES